NCSQSSASLDTAARASLPGLGSAAAAGSAFASGAGTAAGLTGAARRLRAVRAVAAAGLRATGFAVWLDEAAADTAGDTFATFTG
ncbi:hypothetical protein COLO4_00857, partial [Corchorus olitorius]